MTKMTRLAKKLTFKHAQSFPTMRSAPGTDAKDVNIPKAPKVPNIEMAPQFMQTTPPESEFEVNTPDLVSSDELFPIPIEESDLFSTPTLRPEQLEKLSPYKNKLITAIDAMYYSNLITGIYRAKSIETIQRSLNEANLIDLHQEIHKLLVEAELHAIEYAHKMKKIRSHID